MTISESDPRSLPRIAVVMADVDHPERVCCTLCGTEVTTIGTPSIPRRFIRDKRVPESLDGVPVRAYECERHRYERVINCEPASMAPGSFASVEALIDSEPRQIAVPKPVLKDQEVRQ